jgi:CHASE3 domain sensor protein
VPLLLGVYLLMIATAGGLGWEALVHRDRTLARVEGELAPARDAARRLLSSLVDQETAVRGYVITGDEEFLGPYRTAAPQSRELLAELRELLAPEDRWMGQIDEIASHEERWRVEVAEPEIAATTDRRPGEAAALWPPAAVRSCSTPSDTTSATSSTNCRRRRSERSRCWAMPGAG